MPYQQSSRRESGKRNKMSLPHIYNCFGNHQALEPTLALVLPLIKQWHPVIGLHEQQYCSLKERIEFVVDIA